MDSLDEILAVGRATRKRTPRVIWVTAMIVGTICAAFFVVMLFTDSSGQTSRGPWLGDPEPPSFLTGLLVGLAVGASVGLAVGRYRRAPAAGHSDASTP